MIDIQNTAVRLRSGALALGVVLAVPGAAAGASLPAPFTPQVNGLMQEAFAAGRPRESALPPPPPIIRRDLGERDGADRWYEKRQERLEKALPATYGPANPEGTQAIVNEIERAVRECSQLPNAYRHECLAKKLQEISEKIAETGDYAEAKTILRQAADRIEAVTRANIDRTQPRLVVRGTDPVTAEPTRTPPISAVRPESLDAVDTAVESIIEEAATQLLRSTESSEARQLSYLEIAEAVDSTKVLLRS